MDMEATEKNLQEMREFSKLQKISYAKMASKQENCEKLLNEKERSLEQKLREVEYLMEEAKCVADRRLDLKVKEGDPDFDYYANAAAYAEGRLYPTSGNRSHTRSWEEMDNDLIKLQGFLDPE